MTGRLQGKVCFVTGAASGIGLAIAAALAAAGGIVEGADIRAGAGGDIPIHRADVSDPASIAPVIAGVYSRHGRLDVLVNCAGICPPGKVTTTDPAVWDQVFAVNVKGCYLASAAAIPYMEMQQKGSIIHIASNYGLVGGRNAAAYCASKGAVVALTRAMALDHAPAGIRVNCICPGTIDTPLIREPMRSMGPDEIQAVTAGRLARHPLGRIGLPEEVGPGVVYLASDESSFVTGAVLAIDGGYTAQ